MSRKSTRRDFVKQTSALGVAWWVGSSVNLAAQERSPMERLNFACIGVDGKGDSDSNDAGVSGNAVAICDIDDLKLEKKSRNQNFRKAKKYNDYRKMLEEMGDEIDAVTVSTPDHSHAPASLTAMRLGINCFCQKPLTWSIQEARMMREVAAEKKVATQMGNQGTAENGLRECVEIVRAGGIGDVKEVHVWTNRPIWPQGVGRPEMTSEPPKFLHWDLFLGPAAERPFAPVYHPFKWRGWLDFGTGALGDMACHTANMAVMALDLYDPETVVVTKTSGIVEDETYPANTVIEFQFPARKASYDSEVELPPVKMIWYDGGEMPPQELLEGEKQTNSGLVLVGSKGKLYSPNDYGASYVLLPKEQFQDYQKPEQTLPRSPGHFDEFVIACKGGPAAMSNFDYAGRLTETILLGNVALRYADEHGVGEPIQWDAKNMQVKNAKDFTGGITREYREGFGIEA